MDPQSWVMLAALFLIVILSAFFSASETAFMSASHVRLKTLQQSGDKGAATALVTPMKEDGVDYEALGRMIDWQIASGIDALVVCATTGEAPTLTDNEHIKLI